MEKVKLGFTSTSSNRTQPGVTEIKRFILYMFLSMTSRYHCLFSGWTTDYSLWLFFVFRRDVISYVYLLVVISKFKHKDGKQNKESVSEPNSRINTLYVMMLNFTFKEIYILDAKIELKTALPIVRSVIYSKYKKAPIPKSPKLNVRWRCEKVNSTAAHSALTHQCWGCCL